MSPQEVPVDTVVYVDGPARTRQLPCHSWLQSCRDVPCSGPPQRHRRPAKPRAADHNDPARQSFSQGPKRSLRSAARHSSPSPSPTPRNHDSRPRPLSIILPVLQQLSPCNHPSPAHRSAPAVKPPPTDPARASALSIVFYPTYELEYNDDEKKLQDSI
jgi:hypothetical protein